MSRTNLDFLFQVIGPTGDRGGFCQLPRAEELFPPFGDHLNKAASKGQNSPTAPSRPDYLPVASDLASNDSGSPKESSQDDAATVAKTTAEDRDDEPSDESCGPDHGCQTPLKNESVGSPEDSVEANEDNESDEDNTDKESASELVPTAVSAIDANVAKSASADTAKVGLQEPTVESAIPKELSTDPTNQQASNVDAAPKQFAAEFKAADVAEVDPLEAGSGTSVQIQTSGTSIEQPAATKVTKKSASAKSTDITEDKTHADRNELPDKRGVTVETNGDAIVENETVDAADGSSKADQPVDKLEQSNESETGADEPRRDSSARSAGRQRVDAEAILNKVAATAVANAVAPQPRDDGAVTESTDQSTPVTKVGAAKTEGLADAGNRLQANHKSAKGGGRTDSANELPRIDPARFVSRVAKAFHTAQERGGTLQLRLSPPELGALRLELTVKDGVMTAALETETASARRVLLEHLPALRDRLAEQNIRIERFDVEVRREGSGGQADPRAPQDRQSQQQGHPERRQPAMQQRESAAPRSIASIAPTQTNNTGINLVA